MVAEATPETKPQIEELQPPSTEGDADARADADAAAASEAEAKEAEAALTAEATEALKAHKEQASKEGIAATPEAETVRRPVVDPEQVRQARQTFDTNYGNRQREFDADHKPLLDLLTDAGVPEATAKLAVDAFIGKGKQRLNSHHADSLKFAAFEAVATEIAAERDEATGAFYSIFPKAQHAEVAKALADAPHYQGAFQIVHDRAAAEVEAKYAGPGNKGYDDIWTGGFKAGRRQGEGTQSSASSGTRVEGVGSGGGKNFASFDDANTAFNNNDITAEEWKRQKDKFAPSTRS